MEDGENLVPGDPKVHGTHAAFPEEGALPERAFPDLLKRNRESIYWFIFALVPDHHIAEEIFQRASVVIWRKFDQFTPGTNFLNWVKQIVRYEVLIFQRSQARDRLVFWPDTMVNTVAEAWDDQEDVLALQNLALKDCLEKLPERDRELVKLRYGDHKTTSKQLASKLKRSTITIYKSLARIRKALFECIERRIAPERRI